MFAKAILHVDMDAFYASIEQHDNPQLKGKPVIVGGCSSSRGVVSTASYEARKYGVHSAMPASTAHRLCPNGIFLPVRMGRYAEVSSIIHRIFHDFTPLVMPLSCDEAFLDVTGSVRLLGEPVQIVQKLKTAIKDATGLTASVGLAGTLFMAKVASDMNKPNGLTVVADEDVIATLAPLPIRRMWGVGKVAEKKMQKFGIRTIGDLQKWPRDKVVECFGDFGAGVYNLCRGIDERTISGENEAEKSVSNETTFDRDVMDIDELKHTLLALSDKVARRSRRQGYTGRTVQIKVRYNDFTTITRQMRLPGNTDCSQEIYKAGRTLLQKSECGRRPVRLIGIGISSLGCGTDEQGSLFGAVDAEKSDKMSKAERAADKILDKLGNGTIGRGSLLLE